MFSFYINIFFIIYLYLFISFSVLYTKTLCTSCLHYPQKPEEGGQILGTAAKESYLPFGCPGMNWYYLQLQQQALLASDPSPHALPYFSLSTTSFHSGYYRTTYIIKKVSKSLYCIVGFPTEI